MCLNNLYILFVEQTLKYLHTPLGAGLPLVFWEHWKQENKNLFSSSAFLILCVGSVINILN